MNYQKIYKSLINRSQNRLLEGYVEMHHIVPRCMGGGDSPANLAILTPEEHYLAHLLLVKIYPYNRKLLFAVYMMCNSNSKQNRNNKIYGWLKRKRSSLGLSEETKQLLSDINKGKILSEETKIKISESLKGRTVSEETKIKIGIANSKIMKDKVSNGVYIPWNTGKPMTLDTKEQLSISLKQTYINGRELSETCFKKGCIPWNKGEKQDLIKCPYCDKTGGISVMKRWHFERCKHKSDK